MERRANVEYAVHNTQNNKIIKPSLFTRSLASSLSLSSACISTFQVYLFISFIGCMNTSFVSSFQWKQKIHLNLSIVYFFYLPHFVSHAIRARVNMFHMRFIMFSCTKSNLQLKKQCIACSEYKHDVPIKMHKLNVFNFFLFRSRKYI